MRFLINNKQFIFLLISLVCCFQIDGFSQDTGQFLDTIEVCTEKNSYIKLSGLKIKHLDMGGEDNILFLEEQGVIKLKAQTKGFQEKNFLVIGSDTLVQFLIRYNANPKKYLYSYNIIPKVIPVIPINTDNQTNTISENNTKGNEKSEPVSNLITNDNKIIRPISGTFSSFDKVFSMSGNTNIGLVKNSIKIRMTNLAVDKQHLYLSLTITNNSLIEYFIDYVNFEVRSKGKMQDTGEQSIYPEFQEYSKNSSVVKPLETIKLVYALDKFYLRPDEILTVSLFEKSTASKGRQYALNLSAREFKLIENLK